MNTPTHALLNAAILRKENTEPLYAWSILTGSILPDIPMVIFFFYERFVNGASGAQIWGDLYFNSNWTIFFDLFNSIPIFLIGMAITYWVIKSKPVFLIFMSMLLHALADFPLHTVDAHRHFYPFSNYKFVSSISYWDPAEGGNIIAILEILLGLAASYFIWKKLRSKWSKAAVVIFNLLAIISFTAFYLYGFWGM